ncbi:unnamed protein product [Albugo candida]|uniref:Uncharacterized protein n=1 Tax=Albugo candida TaxID=65357 RepID=A0A024G7N3_9STRA|nr:unnamed protein product [Albugo candida]|eukprot:CCI42866.1 unnamed protein product [Albugo candida]
MTRSNNEERLHELEKVLKEISSHEERKNLESVQQSFVETRQLVLQQQLESTKTELEACVKSKAVLCEKIGELEQVFDFEKVFSTDGEKRRRGQVEKQKAKHQATQCYLNHGDFDTTSPTSVSSSKAAFIDPIETDTGVDKVNVDLRSDDHEVVRLKKANDTLACEKSSLAQDLDTASKALILMEEKYASMESQYLLEQENTSKSSEMIARLELDLHTTKETLAKQQQSIIKPEEDMKALDTCERIKMLEVLIIMSSQKME